MDDVRKKEEEGEEIMMKRTLFPMLVLSTIVLTSGCSSKGDAKTGREEKTSRPPVAVEVLRASISELVEGIDVVGALSPKFEAELKSQIPGLILEVYVTEWVRVKKDAPLARIDVSEVEAFVRKAEAAAESAKAGHLHARVAAQRAEREKARMLKLREYGLATQQNLDDAETETAAASARVDAARAQFSAAEWELHQAQARLSKGMIRSPMNGVVSYRDVNVGDLASDTGAAKALFKIVDSSILNLTVTVPSVEMTAVKVGNPLTFTVDALPGKTFYGKVKFVNPVVDQTDRSVKVIAEVENSSGELKAGLFAKGRILTGMKRNVLQVPRSALLGLNIETKKAGLYVVNGDTAHFRSVATGIVTGDRVQIASGINPGERFVIRGGFNLKDGYRVIVSGEAD